MMTNESKNFIMKKTGIDIREHRNSDLIKNINPNTYILFSENDEFVSKNDELMFSKNYSSNCKIKNFFYFNF